MPPKTATRCLCFMLKIEGHRFSSHAEIMVSERRLDLNWIEDTLKHPEVKRIGDDGNLHYIKVIRESNGRHLRIVVNSDVNPPKIVTLFFDRRLKELK